MVRHPRRWTKYRWRLVAPGHYAGTCGRLELRRAICPRTRQQARTQWEVWLDGQRQPGTAPTLAVAKVWALRALGGAGDGG